MVLGIVVGALPGLTATMAMIVLLPLTFGMPPITSIQLLMGVFVGGITAGSVTAIAVSIPGTAASAPTALEGAAFRRQGRAGEAISLMYITSMIGGILGAIAFITVAPLLARFALSFGPPEYFLLMLISMSLVISLSSASLLKGLIAALLGMASSLVGVDPMTATPRMTFGISELEAGLGYGAVIIGLFGLTEVLTVLAQPQDATGPLQADRSAYRCESFPGNPSPAQLGLDHASLDRGGRRRRRPARTRFRCRRLARLRSRKALLQDIRRSSATARSRA